MNVYCRIVTCSGTSSPCDLKPHIKLCSSSLTGVFQMDIVIWMVMALIHLRWWMKRMRLCMWNSIIRYIVFENHCIFSEVLKFHLITSLLLLSLYSYPEFFFWVCHFCCGIREPLLSSVLCSLFFNCFCSMFCVSELSLLS